MTLDELRDWHAVRIGWKHIEWCEGCWNWRHDKRMRTQDEHPFPATLDAADASFPPNWNWYRGEKIWSQGRFVPQWWAFTTNGKPIGPILATDSKIRDLYELSKLAWEQEEA